MCSRLTESRLMRLLDELARGEKQVEIHRQMLAEMPDFSPYQAFVWIDKHRNDYITFADIQAFMRDNLITTSDAESYDLMKSFDKYGLCRLSFTE